MSNALELAFLLPTPGWPRAVFQSDFGFRRARVLVEGEALLESPSRERLQQGIDHPLEGGAVLSVRLVERDGDPEVELCIQRGGEPPEPALREDRLAAPPTRSAWLHAFIAFAGSAAGFLAGYLYLQKAWELESAWALKMAYHTAGWHLLLTFTLFPASVWGQRLGIRAVQLVSAVFFCIHAGIAAANWTDPDSLHDGAIAWLNAVSGLLFLASTVYGQRAYRDMDPIRALRNGRL